MKIGNSEIGSGHPVYIIAEIGLCHNGSLDDARALIDIAIDAGANAVKFQKRDVANLAVPEVLDAPDNRFPSFGKTYREIRQKIEFSEKEFDEIFQYGTDKGITVFCTPFDINSLRFLKRYDPPVVKIASHSVTNWPLLKELAKWNKPVIMSTGMCTYSEIDDAVRILNDLPVVLLHCVSSYPTNFQEANLKMIDVLRERYQVPVGFSTHEEGFLATLAAVIRGAGIIERHITLDHDQEGFDHKIALTSLELAEMIQKIREIEKMLVFHEKAISDKELITRKKYQVSAIAKTNLSKGAIFTEKDIDFKNPGIGLTPKQIQDFYNHRLKRNVKKNEIFSFDMFE